MADMMTLEEAMKHIEDMLMDPSRIWECVECRQEHVQLLKWLVELSRFRTTQLPRVLKPIDFDENPDRDDYGNLPCWMESREPLIASGWNRWNVDDFIRPQMRNFRPWTSRPTDAQREAEPWQ